jgi:hypothetical protein
MFFSFFLFWAAFAFSFPPLPPLPPPECLCLFSPGAGLPIAALSSPYLFTPLFFLPGLFK